MKDPRKVQADRIKDFAKQQGADGLVECLFFQDSATKYVLSSGSDESKKLKNSLIAIISGEDPLAKLHQESVNAQIDSIPLTGCEGFLPVAAKFAANMNHQIAAIKYLAPFIEKDDAVFETLWDAANGKRSNITNVADAAISALAHGNPKRKQELRKIAIDPQIDQYVRWKAHTILAFYDLTKDRSVYGLVCNLADDHSISDLYEKRGMMSPNVKFWYKHECDMRKQYPEQHKDGKNDEQIKQDVVCKVQAEFREGIFEVMGYILDHRDGTSLHNEFLYPHEFDEPRRFERFDSSLLTTQMCNLIQKQPSYHLQVLCRYIKKISSLLKAEVEQVCNALKAIKADSWHYSHHADWIDSTLYDMASVLKSDRR